MCLSFDTPPFLGFYTICIHLPALLILITTATNQWLITINRLADNHQPFGS